VSGVDDLVQWLTAQLDEDERIARGAGGDSWRRQDHPSDTVAIYDSKGEPVVYDEGWPTEEQAEFVAEWNPARVLREIDSKRRTLVRCQEAMLAANPMLVHFAKQTVREMALPYADQRGYEEALAAFA
jgi:hypothetical protein